MNELLSIVIPVRNAGKYIDACLRSATGQSYSNIEIIAVVNGSNDNSLTICKEWEELDDRITTYVLDKANVTEARKHGTECARGEYVVFLDADDYVDPDYYETLLNHGINHDVITAGYYNGEAGKRYDGLPPRVYESKEELSFFVDNMIFYREKGLQGITRSIWNKMFRRDMALKVFDVVNSNICVGEDCDFIYHYFLECHSIVVSRICGYHYNKNYYSTAHTAHELYLQDMSNLYVSLKNSFRLHERSEALYSQLEYLIREGALKSTKRMGFGKDTQIIQYVYPFYNMFSGERIVLYGAGQVGKDYYVQLKAIPDVKIVTLVDRESEKYKIDGIDVISPDELQALSFDKIIISVLFRGDAMNILESLIRSGFDKEIIMWREPINLAKL